MARIDGSLLTTTGDNQLAHGTLRVWDAIAISVSLIAPGMAMLLNTSDRKSTRLNSSHRR